MGIKSRFANPNKDVKKSFRPFGDRFQINFCVGFFLRFAPGVVDDHLLLVVDFQPVEALVLLELVHSPTELDVLRAPGVPGGSAAHPSSLAGLDTLQEVVLLLLAQLLRPVEQVVLGDADVVPLVVTGHHVLPRLVLQPDPGECEGVGHHVVEFRGGGVGGVGDH